MAGKRSASSDLNHENWDRDEEPEDAGTFQKASDELLKRRVIKTARRRNPISSVRSNNDDSEKKSAFTGFTAFSKATTPTTTAFSFLSNLSDQTDRSKTNGISENKSTYNFTTSNTSIFNKAVSSSITKDTTKTSNEYFSKLKGLNESVSSWIKKHVDTNPFINLQPIFKDYEKFFKELEKEESKSVTSIKNIDVNKKEDSVPSMSNFVFKAAENAPESTAEKAPVEIHKVGSSCNTSKATLGSSGVSTFGNNFFTSTSVASSFGSNTSITTPNALNPSSSFGANSANPTNTGFPGAKPFTFGNLTKPATEEPKEKEEDDDDEPPKVNFTPVIEKDNLYTIRCKVFVKKDANFGDRGVGNLYLKPIENSEKVQLIVRADTNLGNLLCNFILSENIPIKRIGKKDVMLVCLPTPNFTPPPVPVLLRVKSPEEADNLLENLEKFKK